MLFDMVYPLTLLNPGYVEGFQERFTAVAVVPVSFAWKLVGASGTLSVVIEADGNEGDEENSAELFATTVKVYCVPIVNPVTRILVEALIVVAVAPPGLAVTVYVVMVELPLNAGTTQETWADVL